MFNKNKNLISFVFLSLTLFAFGTILFTPKSASASYIGWQGENYVYCYYGDPINGCGGNSSFGTGNQNNIINPVPAIYSISPRSSNLNWNTTTITITGSNFITNSVVSFNSSERSTIYINSGTLQVQLNSNDLTNAGTFPITVFNGGPGGGMSNSVSFTVTNRKITNASGTTTSKTNSRSTATKTTSNSTNTTSTNSTNSDSNGNSLSANALFASDGFVPANFLQWLFVLILILLIVVLWRKIYITDKDRAIPLKHA